MSRTEWARADDWIFDDVVDDLGDEEDERECVWDSYAH